MKTDISNHKKQLAAAAEKKLPIILTTYNSGDLAALGELCHSLNVLAEFYLDNPTADFSLRVPNLVSYLNDKFANSVCLVLKKDSDYFAYTANNVTKFVRGETVHGASDNRDKKRKTLHDYTFENDDEIEWEFHISWNFIAGPNLRSSTGNKDSDGPYVHAVNINGRRVEVATIESIILAIAFEFWQAATNNTPSESTKTFVKFNPNWYEQIWGTDVTSRVATTLTQYYGLELPELDES